MKQQKNTLILILALFLPFLAFSQIDEDQTGAWYMYFWNTTLKESSFGFQGDVQVRNWNVAGDLEQLLLRGGLTWKPDNADVKFTLGYGYILTGDFGNSKETRQESRLYQETLLPHKVGTRFYLTHRFRAELRFVENQDTRTRVRYNFFINVPFNQTDLSKGAVYLALYNEIFLNGEREIGDGRTVEIFDRNRTYAALGYSILDNLRIQLGYMQQTTDTWAKGQIQLSLHHKW